MGTPLSFDADAVLQKTKQNYKEPFTLTIRPPTEAELHDERSKMHVVLGNGSLSVRPSSSMMASPETMGQIGQIIETIRQGVNHGELGQLLSATGEQPTVTGIVVQQHVADAQGRRTH